MVVAKQEQQYADEHEHAFIRLKSDDPVQFCSDACLIVRRPGAECGLCREACPKSVLTGGLWSITLEADGCIGCGLCAAACPTGALLVDGFASDAEAPSTEVSLLECHRVSPADRVEGATSVPCLGGLTAPDLLDRAAVGNVVLVDRRLCETCGVGCGAAPWRASVAEVRRLMAAVDTGLSDRVQVTEKPLDPASALPVLTALRPDKAAKLKLDRRELFKRIVAPQEPIDVLAESRRVIEGRGLIAPIARGRVVARIAALADAQNQTFPPALLPAVKVADGCGLHAVCAAICPTGALRLDLAASTMALSFEASECISCGECQRACPTRALTLWPEGDGASPEARATLITRRRRVCDGCGDSFAVPETETDTCLCQEGTRRGSGLATDHLG